MDLKLLAPVLYNAQFFVKNNMVPVFYLGAKILFIN